MPDKLVLRVAPGDPLTVGSFLRKRVPEIATTAAALIKSGGVHVNGARVKHDKQILTVGARVIVYTLARVRTNAGTVVIVHRDDDLAVVDKPSGMLSQPTAAESASALDAVLAEQLGREAVPLHRLDRETSGLVLVALSADVRATLADELAAHRVQREYVAIVKKLDQVPARIALRIARDPEDPRRRRALPEADLAGEAAVTHVTLLAQSETRTVLLLALETGRTHQIRVHLAAIGAPIVGDALYGGEPAARLLLHAARLRLVHPATRKPLEVRSPVPSPLSLEVPTWDANLIFAEDRSH